MHGRDLGGQRQRELEGVLGDPVPVLNGDDHNGSVRLDYRKGSRASRFLRDATVVAAHPQHRREHGDDEQRAHPCPLPKLGDQHDQQRDPRRDGPEAVDEHAVPGAAPSHALPVRHHPRLRQRKCQEGADRVERDQPVRHAAKEHEEHGRECPDRERGHAQGDEQSRVMRQHHEPEQQRRKPAQEEAEAAQHVVDEH